MTHDGNVFSEIRDVLEKDGNIPPDVRDRLILCSITALYEMVDEIHDYIPWLRASRWVIITVAATLLALIVRSLWPG